MIQPSDDPGLGRLLAKAMERIDEGAEPKLEELCHNCPELLGPLREALEVTRRLPTLLKESSGRDPLVRQCLGDRYELEARLGAGAMGVVYRASDLELERDVAVKVLRAPLLDRGETAERRFAREARLLAAVDHPAIVKIHDRGRTPDDDPFLVMELLEGLPLSAILDSVAADRDPSATEPDACSPVDALDDALDEPLFEGDGSLRVRFAVRCVATLAGGLVAAHAEGIVHRDVKPSNVFLGTDGKPVLLDFGIASQVDQATLTQDGSLLGTPAYMAPESLEGRGDPGPAIDVYGLSATLYHLVTSVPPYSGTPTRVLADLAVKDVRPAGRLRPGLPRDLLAILDRGMARKPSDRYASASALEADLLAFLDHRPVVARRLSPLARAWRRMERSPAWRAGALVSLFLLLALGGWRVSHTWAEHRAARSIEAWRRLPPNLTLFAPQYRVLPEGTLRDEFLARLDRVVDVAYDPLAGLLLRAAFRLDHGDTLGCAQDMRQAADRVGSAYTAALAERYAALAPGSPFDALDLAGLPEPSAALDDYIAAFHCVRDERKPDAAALLDGAELSSYVPARELWLFASADSIAARDPEQLESETAELEELLGARTAFTANLTGIALLLQRRYAAGYAAIEEGLALAPQSFVLQLNAGRLAWRLHENEAATEHYRSAIELEPRFRLTYELLITLLADRGDLEGAAQLCAHARDDAFASPGELQRLDGDLEAGRALFYAQRGEANTALEAARRGRARSAEAACLGARVRSARARFCNALADKQASAQFVALLGLLREQPLHPRRIELLSRWAPDALDHEQTRTVFLFLSTLARELEIRMR